MTGFLCDFPLCDSVLSVVKICSKGRDGYLNASANVP